MIFRTDLALEAAEEEDEDGVFTSVEPQGDCTVTRVKILPSASRRVGKPAGTYITAEFPPFSDHVRDSDQDITLLSEELRALLPDGPILVAGLGNRDITPDALGPKAADRILATRHVRKELARVAGMENLRAVSVLVPGVLGDTGIETAEALEIMVSRLHPAGVIAIDALAARSLRRLGNTVQISDSGIAPGSGIGNMRPPLSRETLGVPVIGVGVPTVVSGSTFAADLLGADDHDREALSRIIAPTDNIMVTVREVDLLISRASDLVAMAVNLALNPGFTADEYARLA
ncbi:GPR endopeptidase [Yeguia hominis]|uniref:Germination protease n=1 Tax=Yeguia hominis TaxID=2763662 RepID=A0A926HSL7_9FIRM|nr:GPR endopeptidase [Yeguia hominis]MBC8534949.1 GPR endopeptidase [Yeguia hominis]